MLLITSVRTAESRMTDKTTHRIDWMIKRLKWVLIKQILWEPEIIWSIRALCLFIPKGSYKDFCFYSFWSRLFVLLREIDKSDWDKKKRQKTLEFDFNTLFHPEMKMSADAVHSPLSSVFCNDSSPPSSDRPPTPRHPRPTSPSILSILGEPVAHSAGFYCSPVWQSGL